jgi:predicted nucleic acid-binding protein/GNAT superfamily N-acetyltransferase
LSSKIPFRVQAISHTSPHLAEVERLGRANRTTLGFLPDGAFEDRAAASQILVAVAAQSHRVMGYLLYRVSHHRAIVVHLCVDHAWRGQGIARALADHLSHLTRELRGIGLKGRRDYAANALWPRLGFVAQGGIAGRSRDGSELTYWWRDHDHPTLFRAPAGDLEADRVQVVIDMNVFIDLFGNPRSPTEAEESRCLQADWLSDIELQITDELFNEIDRINSPAQRGEARRQATRLPRVTCTHSEFDRVLVEVRSLFPSSLSDSDESDLRQLSRAVAAQARFFVTRDSRLLKIADDLHARYQVSVLRPSDLAVHFDELLREPEYAPSRLAGTPLAHQRVRAGSGDELTKAFRVEQSGEKASQFAALLHRCLADPRRYECSVVRGDANTPLALTVVEYASAPFYRMPLFRLAHGPLAVTLAHHLAFSAVSRASALGRCVVQINDPFLPNMARHALATDGFVNGPSGWMKLTLAGIHTHSALSAHLSDLLRHVPQEYMGLHDLPTVLARIDPGRDLLAIAEIEHLLWPAKVADAAVPAFVVPIRPGWAQHLFDESLAGQTLFGADTELSLRRECVYYRARRPAAGLAAPARLLWYVSQGGGFHGTGAIRACSSLDAVVVGPASELYKRYRRYGVYKWPEILALARGNPDAGIMALRFRDTELLPSPVPWADELRAILGRAAPLQSPARVPAEAFTAICAAGRRRQAEVS